MDRPMIEKWKKFRRDFPRTEWGGGFVDQMLAYICHLEEAIDMTVADGNIGNLMEIWDQIPRKS